MDEQERKLQWLANEQASRVVIAIRSLVEECQIPEEFENAGLKISSEDLRAIAISAVIKMDRVYPNPRAETHPKYPQLTFLIKQANDLLTDKELSIEDIAQSIIKKIMQSQKASSVTDAVMMMAIADTKKRLAKLQAEKA